MNGIIVGQGPRSEFQSFLVEALTNAGVPARIATNSELPADLQLNEVTVPDYEVHYVLVPEDDEEEAKAVVDYTVFRCKICLHCQAFIKPCESVCKLCGTLADPRDPDEIRAAYQADWLAHQSMLEDEAGLLAEKGEDDVLRS